MQENKSEDNRAKSVQIKINKEVGDKDTKRVEDLIDQMNADKDKEIKGKKMEEHGKAIE